MELVKQLLSINEARVKLTPVNKDGLYEVTKSFISTAHGQRAAVNHGVGSILKVVEMDVEDDSVKFMSDTDEDMDGDKDRPIYTTRLGKFRAKVKPI